MRWKAATVSLAALLAVALLLSPTAWGQATTEPTPSPGETVTPAPEESEEPAEDEAPTGTVEESTEGGSSHVSEEPASERGGDRTADGTKALATPTKLHLYANPKTAHVGERVRVWGKVAPAQGGLWVKIVNAVTGYKLRALRTENDGTFEGSIRLRKNVAIKATWENLRSEWRRLRAIPKLRVHLSKTLLFAKSKVSGHINKVAAGKWIQVKIRKLNNGKVVERRGVKVDRKGDFKARVMIDKPGDYRASAVFDRDGWVKSSDKSRRRTTPLPSLSRGAHNIYVKLLEKRLKKLGHHLAGRSNKSFGQDTADAVMAFNKVNRRARVSYVTSSTWGALATERRPRARFDSPGFHIEVNQSKQVLYVVRGGKVRNILHVSTGASSTPTYDGTYQFWGKVAGYSPKRLYYPSYFHGARAIHGWPEVPPYNASHGCVRVPMWAAKWIYAKIEIGDTIRIYH